MDEWRCRSGHPPFPGGGVCPHCLRDCLLRLCPDCACPRPCACSPASSPSSSSSGASASAAVGRAHSLVDRDHCAVARSRSLAAADGQGRRPRSGVWGWVSFRKPPAPAPAPAGRCVDVEEEYDDAVALARSRSVATAEAKPAAPSKASGWGRLIPGKIKALRSRKARAAGDDWRHRDGARHNSQSLISARHDALVVAFLLERGARQEVHGLRGMSRQTDSGVASASFARLAACKAG
ncbi:hypothetical protein U9M48_033619 [Paspalum notatum var. saurae]|uniref:Uncharacterized protein n=1 Tax=Paspalum notatum var. saurae TaxID=547442 RepID=A0AAQ3UAA3_PASNO